MNTVETLNAVTGYIEAHIEDDLDIATIAGNVAVSPYDLQRMFSFTAEMSLKEYIRKRRLTLAGIALQSGKHKVIDIALRFGYRSPTSFSHAFQLFHGVTPLEAKKSNVKLNHLPRLMFHIAIKRIYDVIKTERITLLGTSYQASYFGEQDISCWSERFCKRTFWRLEGAYDMLKHFPKSGDVLPYNNYPPIDIQVGQAFVIDYHEKQSGKIVRRYYLADRAVWQHLPCTSEVILNGEEGERI